MCLKLHPVSWHHFLKMVSTGDVIYFNLLGQQMIVIGSIKAAFDLLDKKSANFSGRPVSTVMKL